MTTEKILELKEEKRRLIDEYAKAIEDAEAKPGDASIVRKMDDCERQIHKLNLEIEKAEHRIEKGAGNIPDHPSPHTNYLAKLARGLYNGGKGQPDEIRALTSAGGSVVINDPVIAGRFLYALQSSNQLQEAGAQFITMDNNTVFPKVTGYPDTNWVSEGAQVTEDASLTIGSVKFDFSDLAILVRVQNQVLQDSSDRADTVIQEAIRRQSNDQLLKAVLYGASGSNQPDGLDNIAGVQTVSSSSVALTNYALIIDCVKALLDANVPMVSNVSAFMPPVVWSQVAKLTSDQGEYLTRPPMLEGMRFFTTSAIKEDYGGGSDETRVYTGDFSNLVIGFKPAIEMTLTERYSDYLQTGYLLHLRVDVQCLHSDTFCRLEDIATS